MGDAVRQRFSYLRRLAPITVGFVGINLLFNLIAVAFFGYLVQYNASSGISWQVNALITMVYLAFFPALFDSWVASFACALIIGGSVANVASRSLWPGVPDYIAAGGKILNVADLTLLAGQALLLAVAIFEIASRRRRG